jgi:hypothetical protein
VIPLMVTTDGSTVFNETQLRTAYLSMRGDRFVQFGCTLRRLFFITSAVKPVKSENATRG